MDGDQPVLAVLPRTTSVPRRNGGGAIPLDGADIAWSSVGALREFIGKSQVPYTFKGELGVSGGPLQLSVPFELRGQLSRQQLAALGQGLLSPLSR